MTIAVMPRRSRPRPVRSASSSGVRPSASTAASSWRILRRWRAPRSAGSTVSRWPLTVSPTARFSPERLVGDRRRGPDRDLGGGVVAGARLHGGVEVEEDPGVGGLLEVELLDLDLAESRGRAPVDPVHRVARRVRAHRRGERRGLERALGGGVGALDAGRWQPPQRQGLDARVDDQRDPLPHPGRGLEEAERVARPDLERLDAVVPAPLEGRPDQPRPLAAGRGARAPAPAARRGAWWGCGPRATASAAGPCCAACR